MYHFDLLLALPISLKKNKDNTEIFKIMSVKGRIFFIKCATIGISSCNSIDPVDCDGEPSFGEPCGFAFDFAKI